MNSNLATLLSSTLVALVSGQPAYTDNCDIDLNLIYWGYTDDYGHWFYQYDRYLVCWGFNIYGKNAIPHLQDLGYNYAEVL